MKHIPFPLTITLPKEVLSIASILHEHNHEAYVVGGCVRDILIGREPKDWDITTNANPDQLVKLFPHSHYDNTYGTVKVVNDTALNDNLRVVEVTTFRTESGYSDNRRPDNVSFSSRLEDDLARRDFTINALALPLNVYVSHETLQTDITTSVSREIIIDLYGGMTDLEQGTIRTVGNPKERFDEDALRLMRAIRFASQLSFVIEQETLEALTEYHDRLETIAKERIQTEFSLLLLSDNPSFGLETARRTGLLQHIAPELLEGVGMEQNQAHAFTVWEHLLRTLQAAADRKWGLELRLAALFHDVGKPATREWNKAKHQWTFYGHDVIGAKMTKMILKRLVYPLHTIDTVTRLVRWHMFFSDTETVTLSAVRRLVRNVGEENIKDLLKLRRADRIGTGRPKEEPYRFRKFASMVDEALRSPTSVAMLAIKGSDLIETFHVKPGPVIGQILSILLEEVLDDPTRNTREYLLDRTAFHMKHTPEELSILARAGKDRLLKEEEEALKVVRSKHRVE